MYREKIDKFIDAHKTEMLEDIAELPTIRARPLQPSTPCAL